MRQSDALAVETAAMRAFDAALQKTGELPARAQVRVLTYVKDQVGEQMDLVQPKPDVSAERVRELAGKVDAGALG